MDKAKYADRHPYESYITSETGKTSLNSLRLSPLRTLVLQSATYCHCDFSCQNYGLL